MLRRLRVIALLVAGLLLMTVDSASAAIVVDGAREPDYGAPLSSQTTQTSFDDNTSSLVYYANGSELDEAYGQISGGVLYLFFTGNMASRLVPEDNPDNSDAFFIFLDTIPGGENVVVDPNGIITGFQLDAGFEADYYLRAINEHYAWSPSTPFQVAYQNLPTSGTGTQSFVGFGTPGSGTLSGGTNPYGIQATVNCSNLGGVTAGCAASSGPGVTTGIEWAIPLAALDNPDGCVRITALITSKVSSVTSNQSLGPMPPGTCSLGPLRTVNLSAIGGDQFFTVCPSTTPAQKLRYH